MLRNVRGDESKYAGKELQEGRLILLRIIVLHAKLPCICAMQLKLQGRAWGKERTTRSGKVESTDGVEWTIERNRIEKISKVGVTHLTVMCRHSLVLVLLIRWREHKCNIISIATVMSSFIDAFSVPLDMALVVVWRTHLHGMSECRPPPRQHRLELLLAKTLCGL